MGNRYKAERRGVAGLMKSAGVHVVLIEHALEGKAFAEAISPDAAPYGRGYVDSFEINSAKVERIAGSRRAVVELANTSRYATAVELGWSKRSGQFGNHAGYHVLSTTADIIENGF